MGSSYVKTNIYVSFPPCQEKKQVLETPIEDRIAGLEDRRATLVSQKMPLERKLAEIQARMKAKEIQDAGRNGE